MGRMNKQKFKRQWEKAIKNNSYIYLEDKTVQKYAKKYFNLTDEMLKDIAFNAKTNYKSKITKEIKLNKQKKVRDALLKDGTVEKTNIRKAINNDRLLKRLDNKNARKNLNKAIQTEFFETLDRIGLFKDKGAFRRALKGNDEAITRFKNKVLKAIAESDKPFEILLQFTERIDKAFQLIYESYPEGVLNSLQGGRVVNKFIDIIETEILRSV